jgi:hypothetical protein
MYEGTHAQTHKDALKPSAHMIVFVCTILTIYLLVQAYIGYMDICSTHIMHIYYLFDVMYEHDI